MSADFFESSSFRDVLNLLSDGKFHSGEELGDVLGVSRAAVWKTLKKFESIGVGIISVKGKGYCIEGGLDLLDVLKINTKYQNLLNINVFSQLDSTNSYLLRQKNPEYQVCLAESQTAGRGRRGRLWVSPFAQNLYLSLGWGFEGGVAALEGLSLAIGLAVVRSLERHGVRDLNLKWPNDIFYKNKKLGGILIELSGDPSGYCSVVVGIGLNVSMRESYSSFIEQPWVSLDNILSEQGISFVGRNTLVSSLLDELCVVLSEYPIEGFAKYKDEWMLIASYVNKIVHIHAGSRTQVGVFRGVDNTGALLLDVEGKELVFHGGEVSLREKYVS